MRGKKKPTERNPKPFARLSESSSARKKVLRPSAAASSPSSFNSGSFTKGPFPIVGIGASAGGLEAFTQLIAHLPDDTGMGFVLVQHLNPQHESGLTLLLARATRMQVREAKNNLVVQANSIYVIPSDSDLRIEGRTLKLEPRQLSRSAARSIDTFFQSLAQEVGDRAIGVILSGTASDGTLGLEAIKAEGGITLAQDDSAKYESMPRSAVASGCVDYVGSPENIGKELARIAKHPSINPASHHDQSAEDDRALAAAHEDDASPLPSGGRGSPSIGIFKTESKARDPLQAAQEEFKPIVLLLREHSGVDFSLYKSTTIERRIVRRMVLNKRNTPDEYAAFLKGNERELDALYSDVLISVTNFFRDPGAFDILQRKVFKKVNRQRNDPPFRIWVLGCSTGQEAYSLAMSFLEATESKSGEPTLQVFATDLNEALLDKARQGLYAKSLVHDISPERLQRFFVEEQGGYRVIKSLRERVVFARQNVMSDPPFSRMDLISCRNLLIYLEPSLQRKALPSFHYALNPNGTLFLGASESVGGFGDLFAPLDKKHKIFSKKAAPNNLFRMPSRVEQHAGRAAASDGKERLRAVALGTGSKLPPWSQDTRTELTAQREADRITVNQFAPPGVLIDADLRILQFRGATSAFLEPPTGKASFDLLKMAREGLLLPLRATIARAKKDNNTVRSGRVGVRENGAARVIQIAVIPLHNLRERCFLVLFQPDTSQDAKGASTSSKNRAAAPKRVKTKDHYVRRIEELETELAETRDYLQSVQEQQELATSELQASGEEVQSANEELQSVNEELETSKEELESSNEELITTNEELAHRNTELNRLNSDLINLQASTNLAIVLLGRDLTIRRFNARAEKQFHLLATDIGRPIGHIRHDLFAHPPSTVYGSPFAADTTADPPVDLERLIADVIENGQERQHEVQDRDGRWFSIRLRPYLTPDNKVDGAVLVLVDIDTLKRNERTIKAARDYAEAILRTARDPVVVLRADLRINTANDAFYAFFKRTPEETEGQLIFELSGSAGRIPELRMLLEGIVPQNSFFNDVDIIQDIPHLGPRRLRLNARRMNVDDGSTPGMILLAIEDVTETQRSHQASAALAAIIETTEDAVFTQTIDGTITSWNRGAERMFGYTASEILEKSVALLSSSRRELWRTLFEKLRGNETVTDVETEWSRKDSKRLWVSLSAAPLTNAKGELIGASIIARDISERKRARGHVELMAEVGEELIKLTTLEQIVRIVGQKIGEHLDVSLCAIVEMDAVAKQSIGHLWQSDDANVSAADRLAVLMPALENEPSADESYILRDTKTETSEPKRKLFSAGIGSVLAIPIFIDDHWLYFLCVGDSSARDWRDDEIQLLRDLSVRLCVRLERLRSEDALRMSEERYYMLFESIDEGFCILEKVDTGPGEPIDFRYVDVNPAFELQANLQDVVGRTMRQVVPNESEEWYAIFDKVLQTGESIRFEQEFQTKARVLDLYAFRIEDATNRRVAIIFKNITERHRLEWTTKAQADALAVLDRRKDEFLAMLSHELRNPLAPIANAARLLSQLPIDNPMYKRACVIIERQVSQLTHLVDDLMEVSRITSGRVQLRIARVAIGSVVERAVDTLRPAIEQQKHELTLAVPSAPIWLDADPARLEQVVVNLLGNAIKYTDSGGHISLAVEQEGTECVLRVLDNGIGIPPELLPHVFDLFTQGERSLDRSRGGLGIGLALVHRLVELHRGRVEVKSPGKGTEFTVRLPIAEAPAVMLDVTSAAQVIRPFDRPLRVLIVDDNPDEVESLSMLVKDLGHDVETAFDGERALTAAAEYHPDVLLLDIGLPGVNGYEVAQSLRKQSNNEALTLVAITGYGQHSDRQSAAQAGFDHHLVKPADFTTLKSILAMTTEKLVGLS